MCSFVSLLTRHDSSYAIISFACNPVIRIPKFFPENQESDFNKQKQFQCAVTLHSFNARWRKI